MLYDEYDTSFTFAEYETGIDPYADYETSSTFGDISFGEYETGCDYDWSDL